MGGDPCSHACATHLIARCIWHLMLRVPPGQGPIQRQHLKHSSLHSFVSSLRFSSPSPVIYRHLLQQEKKLLKTQKASLLPCEGQGSDREHVNADPLAHPFVAWTGRSAERSSRLKHWIRKGFTGASEKLIQAIWGILCVSWILKCCKKFSHFDRHRR